MEESDEEDEASEGEFDGHCSPYTRQSVSSCQQGSQCQADTPHAEQAHDGWLQRVAGTNEDAVTDDGCCKHGFCVGFDAQTVRTRADDVVDRCEMDTAHIMQHTIDCRSTRRARSKSLAPMEWATCTENPMLAAEASPPSSHPVVSTSPMAAEARAPKCPTIEASMKNMMVADICANMDGILRLMISLSFSPCVISRPSRM